MTNKPKTKILLVQPHGFDIGFVLPMSLAYLDAQIDKEQFEVKILDCSLKDITSDSEEFAKVLTEFEPQVVGVTMWSLTYLEGVAVCKKAKSIVNNVITIAGGVHASMSYKKVMENDEIDFLIRGEAEDSFPLLMERIQNSEDYKDVSGLVYRDVNNKVIANNEHTLIQNLDEIKIPDYESIDLAEYHRKGYSLKTKLDKNAPVWLTRGCPYTCQYCSSPMLSGRAMRKHSPEYVTKWIRQLYADGIRFINIIDDNFTFDLEYAKDICRNIISLNLKDLAFGTPNGVRMQRGDTELWSLMKRAGWKAVCIAPESGSKRTLKRMKKGLNPDVIPGIVRDIKKAGLYVHAFFIIGYPGDTMEDLVDTRNLILNTDMDSFSLFIFQALPGTPVFHTLVQAGEITQGYVPTTESFQQTHGYVTPGLEGVNMKLFRFMTILRVYLKKPHKIVALLKTQRLSFIRDQLIHMFFKKSAQANSY
jgi:radical SAM superfamily enzyme YgiQ (UPF0313 family)|tara:strand:- start:1802 stop:3229 length:1428 start_codon:yes stop_codon:yes gene_type:complete